MREYFFLKILVVWERFFKSPISLSDLPKSSFFEGMKNVIVTESGTSGASSANKMTVVIYPFFFFFFFKDQKRLGPVRVFATVINIVNLTNNMHTVTRYFTFRIK